MLATAQGHPPERAAGDLRCATVAAQPTLDQLSRRPHAGRLGDRVGEQAHEPHVALELRSGDLARIGEARVGDLGVEDGGLHAFDEVVLVLLGRVAGERAGARERVAHRVRDGVHREMRCAAEGDGEDGLAPRSATAPVRTSVLDTAEQRSEQALLAAGVQSVAPRRRAARQPERRARQRCRGIFEIGKVGEHGAETRQGGVPVHEAPHLGQQQGRAVRGALVKRGEVNPFGCHAPETTTRLGWTAVTRSCALVVVFLLAACAAPSAGGDGGADAGGDSGTDAGIDARVRFDAGFDAASLGDCPLDGATSWHAAPYTALASGSLEEDRAFYVLAVLEQSPGTRALLHADSTLVGFDRARDAALRDAAARCTADASCVRGDVVPTASDVTTCIGATVTSLASAGALAAVAGHLRGSLLFERFVARGDDDTTLVTEALTEAVADLVAAFDQYAVGELAVAMLDTVVDAVDAGAATDTLSWWQPLARVTLGAMVADGRDEATRHELLATGENAAALGALATVDFTHFPYAAIVVPGQGPTDLATPLDPGGRARCDVAASRYAAGVAPLLLLSGGHVHPDRTTHSEAIEMKHYLMSTYAIPESAILVDPYARHTTTNLRNATRILLRGGVPAAAKVLVVSDVVQTAYMRAATFAMRCDDELHFRPWRELAPLETGTDTCMTLEPISLTADAADPLDP